LTIIDYCSCLVIFKGQENIMNDIDTQPTDNSNTMAKAVYILYLVSIVVGITGIIGVILAYVNRDEAPQWLKSHYQFLIRTFWIGLLFSVIGAILMIVLIGWIVIIFTLIWLIIRCAKGLQLLDKKQPHPDPTTWMF
jgi:uncharacterized membrane protein